MLNILITILPLFLIIFASAILQKYLKVGKEWGKVLNEFALKVGLPVLIFAALAKTQFSFVEESGLLIANSIFLILSFVAAWFLGKLFQMKKKMRLTLFICFGFVNFAYLGIPVLTSVAGNEVLPTVSLIIAVYLFWMFTLGIGYLDYKMSKDKKHVVKSMLKNFATNSLLIAVVLGLIVGSLSVPLPHVVTVALDMVAASVTPVVLVVIGLFMGSISFGKLREWVPVGLFSILTLLVLPACFYYVIVFLSIDPSTFSTSIVEAAMPLAITPFALADKYKLDKKFIARTIVLSTILSIATLPLWISLVY